MYTKFSFSLLSMLIFFLINLGLSKKLGQPLKNENSIIFFALYPSLLQVIMFTVMGLLFYTPLFKFSFFLFYVLSVLATLGLSYVVYIYCQRHQQEHDLTLQLIRWILIYQSIWVMIGPVTLLRLSHL